jgi:xylose dehydrogenase (NAD/NADP)
VATSDKVRWGILGPGGIAAKFVRDKERAANATVVAVGSRSRNKAAAFASRWDIPRVHGSYEELLADPEVDAVYIATPNSLHHPQTMQALAAGKHVLSEKPYTRHPKEVAEVFDAADAKGLVVMEAFMWRHAPQVRRFMELLPDVGELRSIRASFSFVLTNQGDVRVDQGLDGGSLMDVGCYCVSASRLAAGGEPSRVFGWETLADSGVDDGFSGLLQFPSGLVAEIVCGFTSEHRSLEAIGSKGTLLMLDPWLQEFGGMTLNGRDVDIVRDDPYRLEMENMSAAILGKGKLLLGRADALGQARTIDALYRSAASGEVVELGPR